MRLRRRWFEVPAAQLVDGHKLPISTPRVEARTLADAVQWTADALTHGEAYERQDEPESVLIYNETVQLELFPSKARRYEEV